MTDETKPGICPHCGYCSHCGQAPQKTQPPAEPITYPFWPNVFQPNMQPPWNVTSGWLITNPPPANNT
jgi:hypothetical protein